MTVDVVASGSSGNFVVLNEVIGLDCGVPYKLVEPYAKNLKFVFSTHSHRDHLLQSTVGRLATERPLCRFAGGPFLECDFIRSGVPKRQIDVLEPNTRYDYGLFQVEPVELHHDVPCYGLKIFMGGEKAIYAVDTGSMDGITAKDYNLYMIESNHAESGIAARIAEKQSRGEFAYEQRAAKYHMSHEQAIAWLAENAGLNSKYILLHQHKSTEKGGD